MERQDYIDQINDLKATIKRLLGIIDTLKQTLDSVKASNKRNEELVVKLTAQIEELQNYCKDGRYTTGKFTKGRAAKQIS